jgi:hypothetical protein
MVYWIDLILYDPAWGFKIVFNSNYFKLASVRVLFSPRFRNISRRAVFAMVVFNFALWEIKTQGARFCSAENKNTGSKIWQIWHKQCCNPITTIGKIQETIEEYRGVLRISNTAGAKTWQFTTREIPSLWSSEYLRSNSLWNILQAL